MDYCPRTISITVRNLRETAETRSNVSIKVERIVNEYMLEFHGPSTLISSYHDSPPQFITFDITTTTNTPSRIYHLLHNQHNLHDELSQDLASQIFRKATTIDLDRNAITIDVLLTITLNCMTSVNRRSFLAEEKVEKLVRDGVIGEKSGLEMESCSICLENLLEVSEKVLAQMSCSHVFHDRCISRWLYRKNSCPLCRQVLFEHEE